MSAIDFLINLFILWPMWLALNFLGYIVLFFFWNPIIALISFFALFHFCPWLGGFGSSYKSGSSDSLSGSYYYNDAQNNYKTFQIKKLF
jgi:hypothetical protein